MAYIIGSDEVGYGAWAGPLVVCAAAVPVGWTGPPALADSKEFKTDAQKAARIALYAELAHLPVALMSADSATVDALGVRTALVALHAAALLQLLQQFPDASVIVDGIVPIPAVPQARCVAKADSIYPAVMAASVIAKVNRDFLMRQYHKDYPHYGFDTNVGYGGGKTDKHRLALAKHGVSPIHRRSYSPVRDALMAQRQINLFEDA